MSGSPFIPRAYQGESEPVVTTMRPVKESDKIGNVILKVEQYIVGACLLYTSDAADDM
jgi:hypothetical protein